jgi:plasmid stabilization system protein ParE
MANVNLTEQDIDHIARVVATEVPSSLRTQNPREYQRMVSAVVATITNRASTGKFGKTVKDVLNQNRAFSKIAGPERLNPYGKVENAPKASKKTQAAVETALANLAKGVKPEIGGSLHYANPNYSDMSNLKGWVNGMIEAGATKLGIGDSVHYHGTAPGTKAADPYSVSLGGKLGTRVGYQQYAESYKAEADRQKKIGRAHV